jgi:hypothetical protein
MPRRTPVLTGRSTVRSAPDVGGQVLEQGIELGGIASAALGDVIAAAPAAAEPAGRIPDQLAGPDAP